MNKTPPPPPEIVPEYKAEILERTFVAALGIWELLARTWRDEKRES